MTLQLPIEYEQLVALVEQLSEGQRKDLIQRLLALQAQHSIEEKLKLLDDVKLNVPINEKTSARRVDWYDDWR
jgi:HEAT repeat protein